jgi:hypothetical protein
MIDGLGTLISLVGPNTRVIPGHGAITDRSGLIAQRELILAVRAKITALLAADKNLSIEEVIAAKPTASFDAQVSQGPETAERFVRWVFAEVKAGH